MSDFCIEVVCTMRVIGFLIRNFLGEETFLDASYSQFLFVVTLSFLKRKRINRARVDNKVDS